MDKETKTIEETESIPVNTFLKKLKVDGRYFVGSAHRVEYIKTHKKEIDSELSQIRQENPSEASLLEELLKLNSKAKKRRLIDLPRLAEVPRNIQIPLRKTKSAVSPYSARPRKVVESYILLGLMAVSIPISIYLGRRFEQKIEKIVTPYVERITRLYENLDIER
jgi:hypothetical protein